MFAPQTRQTFTSLARADAHLHRQGWHYSHHDPRGRWFYRQGREAARVIELPASRRARIDYGVSA
jgi:hypothetical protein